jgi:hypothetical protein
MARDERVTIRLTKEEKSEFQDFSEKDSRSLADTIRILGLAELRRRKRERE